MTILDKLLAEIDAGQDDIIHLAQDLVRIPSVNTGIMPTGNETQVCNYVREWLAEDGIHSEILEAASGRGNIIARIDGLSEKPGLMFISHTDVVPVEDESKWKFPPFDATVAGQRLYGRGTYDCKGLLAAQMMAMRLLARNNIELSSSLILASGADEEHGGRYGFGWLAKNHPDKIMAPVAVNEGGGSPIYQAGRLTYTLGVGEKGRLQAEVNLTGTSAHASMPWLGDNALYGLNEVLGRIEKYEPQRDTTTSLFEHLSSLAIEHKPNPENIDQIIEDVDTTNPRLASILRALSRMTITPTMVSGGIKSNSVPEHVKLTCDVRTLPHQDKGYVRRELEQILGGIMNLDVTIDYMAEPNESPFKTEFAHQIQESTAQVLGRRDIQFVPAISNAFTDSRFTRSLGVITYGFSGDHPDDDPLKNRIHSNDESIGINSLISSTKIMTALACNVLMAK